MHPAPASPTHRPSIGFGEFVTLLATIMALNALAIDTALPATTAMAQAFNLSSANQAQWVVSAFMIGYSIGQLLYGPLSDRFGRRPVILSCLAAYALFSLVGGFAPTFEFLIALRFLQGLATAGARVVAVAIVRDGFSGAQMSRVMSLTQIVFMIVPLLAPSVGQLILHLGSWRSIFHFLTVFALALLAWTMLRLQETLPRGQRRALSARALLQAMRAVIGNRTACCYTLANAALLGGLFGFINSIQQIYSDIFHAPLRFPLMFALVAGTMAVMALFNSHLVERVGMRRISHSATLVLVLIAGVHAFIAWRGWETEASFLLLQSALMGCIALCMGNFNAIAMEPLGALAGSAASLQGFVTTMGAALLGVCIGQRYDRSTLPLAVGFFGCGLAALALVLVAERARLFGIPPADTA